VNRVEQILDELDKLNLKVHLDSSRKQIEPNTDIYLVNSYGKTKSIYKVCKNIFIGGSLINHGGQNPLEAARYGCNIFHGPYVSNFTEIYDYLDKIKISHKIKNKNYLFNVLSKKFNNKNYSLKLIKKLEFEGIKILNKTYNQIY